MRRTVQSFAAFLSLYRLAVSPVVAILAYLGLRDAFYILLIVSLATDLIDGPLMRWSGGESREGARLDTLADACTVLAGIYGLIQFEGEHMQPHLPLLAWFLGSYVLAALASLVKFGTLPAYHLYLSKAAAFLSGCFVVWLYLMGFSPSFFVAVIVIAMLANFESLLATGQLRQFRTNIGSLVFLLRGDR